MQNVPNLLSLGRLLVSIPLVALVLINQPTAYIVGAVLFVLGSLTDTLDGQIARSYHLVSRIGIYLDLTADKVLVSAVLIALVQVRLVPAWIVIVIVAREFLVSGLRSLAAAQGVVIPAGPSGKQKTLLTLMALSGILLARGFDGHTAFPLGLSTGAPPHSLPDYILALADVLLLVAVVLTIYSALDYTRGAWGVLTAPMKES